MGKYDDIINLPHPVSPYRQKMSSYDRAAQFSPFAALTGHAESIKETARYVDKRVELSLDDKVLLDEKMIFLMEIIGSKPEISVTYFVPDKLKNGGEYVTTSGVLKKIKTLERTLILAPDKKILIDEIIAIDGDIFEKYSSEEF